MDLYTVIQWARACRRFVTMSWGFGSGPTRFHTTLCLTDNPGAHIKFTHGLEMELQLEKYARSVDESREARQAITGVSTPEKEEVYTDSNTGWGQDTVDTCTRSELGQACLDRSQQVDTEQNVAHDPAHQPSRACDNYRPPEVDYRPHYGRPECWSHRVPALPQSHQSASETSVEPPPHVSTYNGNIADDRSAAVQLNQQILEEVLFREKRDAELQFQINGDMTAYRALLPPSMDGARTVGLSGSAWVWSNDVERWYWTDRYGQTWWRR